MGIATALVRLEETNIDTLSLSSDLTTSLLTKMAESSIVNMKRYNVHLRQCSGVPPQLFGEALVRIETVTLRSGLGGFTGEDHLLSLFRKIGRSEETRLKKLNFTQVNISHISPDIVSRAAVKLETLQFTDLANININIDQLTAIFTRL